MAVLNPTGFLLLGPDPAMIERVFCAVVIAVSYVVLWAFWQGRNWARWLVLLTSVLALANLYALESQEPAGRVVLVLEAVLGAYLLYWLNSSSVKAYFTVQSSRAA